MSMSIVTKLEKLKADFDTGNKQLADLQGQINALTTTLVRIQGAVAVLEEISKEESK